MAFIHDDFLLQNDAARRLYHDHAKDQPILDYHNHLPPHDIAENRQFKNLYEIWLEGDHYKWRAMRSNGVDERFVTGGKTGGDTTDYEKFFAWAQTVPHTVRNPLYHWTHLELKRVFGIDELLNENSAKRIWDAANEQLASPEFSARGLLRRFNVTALCTTDDPADALDHHVSVAASGFETKVLPTFRPDKAFFVNQPEVFKEWLSRLSIVSDVEVGSLSGLLKALEVRHNDFHNIGCRLSDHGLTYCPADFPTEAEATKIFDNALAGTAATPEEHGQFISYLMLFLGELDAKRGWTKQLHLGAQRNNNSRKFADLGPDTGFDSIGDWPQVGTLAAYMNRLEENGSLPKMVLYNLNPKDNLAFATLIGNFQDGSVAGKIQFGSGWWFLDTKQGIEWQIDALSNAGLLSRFIGMLTDSRSFLSFPRHEYFRRVLCNMLGTDIQNGEIPDDIELTGPMVENICYGNAQKSLGLI
jgi:glucuronate isomerase